jgi:hypothetical protein
VILSGVGRYGFDYLHVRVQGAKSGTSPTPEPRRGLRFDSMEEGAAAEEDVLSVQLDVHLDRQPVQGRLRTPRGAEEPFVGWLGFVDALGRLREQENTNRKESR